MNYRIVAFVFILIFSTTSHAESLKLAVYPSNDPKKLIIPMRIMAEYISEKSGDKFIAIVTRDYEELSERLKNKSVHIAWINPVNYIKMKAN